MPDIFHVIIESKVWCVKVIIASVLKVIWHENHLKSVLKKISTKAKSS